MKSEILGSLILLCVLVVFVTDAQHICDRPENQNRFVCLVLNRIDGGFTTRRPVLATTRRPLAPTRRPPVNTPRPSGPRETRPPHTGTPNLDQIANELNSLLDSDKKLIAAWVQLGFHSCVGGCDGCLDTTLGHNKGLIQTYADLRIAHQKHQDAISLADFLAFAAIQAAKKGIKEATNTDVNIRFRLGRRDCMDFDNPQKSGNFPEGDDPNAIIVLREELGITRAQAIALLGAHSLGSCKTENTGFDGPWDFSETKLDNGYYRSMSGGTWFAQPTPNGQSTQWNSDDGRRMMLNADMRLWKRFDVAGDRHFPSCSTTSGCPASEDQNTVRLYARNQPRFHQDFVEVFAIMLENTNDVLTG